jgi:ssDNA-binding Zn-finger/Zn-ribbon topoisomerase 1
MTAQQGKKFDWVSLYQVGRSWRMTTCMIDGRRITRRLGRQRSVAERFVAKVSDWIEQHKSGLITSQRLKEMLGQSLPVDGLLLAYERHLTSAGCEVDYIRTIIPRVRIILEIADITRATHITAAAVNRALAELSTKGRKGRPLSDQTIRHYVTSIHQFVRFLMRPPNRVFEVDPLVGLDRHAIDTLVRIRRAPTLEELSLLLQTVKRLGLGVFNMPGRDRCMLYAFALSTGLRAKELRSVLVRYVDLEKGVIHIPGQKTKNGEKCPQCGAPMLLRENRHIFYPRGTPRKFYGCSNYPACLSTHAAHPNGEPCGTPGDRVTREARGRAHQAFDRLWDPRRGGTMDRHQAYRLIARLMGMEEEQAHIANMSEQQCERLVNKLERLRPQFAGSREPSRTDFGELPSGLSLRVEDSRTAAKGASR